MCHHLRGDGGEGTGWGTRCLQPSPLTGQPQVRARPLEPAPRRRGSEDSIRPGHTQGAAVQPSHRRQSRSPPGQTRWQGCGLSCHPTLQSCGPSDVAENGLSSLRTHSARGLSTKTDRQLYELHWPDRPGWGGRGWNSTPRGPDWAGCHGNCLTAQNCLSFETSEGRAGASPWYRLSLHVSLRASLPSLPPRPRSTQ